MIRTSTWRQSGTISLGSASSPAKTLLNTVFDELRIADLCNLVTGGRDRYTGHRIMLRILGDPLPGTGIQPGFPASALSAQAA
jgi:hypothetical protein